jgi:hypothetical protein
MTVFCTHRNVTFPQTTPGDQSAHVTCLDCGAEFDYDWQTMQRAARKNTTFSLQRGGMKIKSLARISVTPDRAQVATRNSSVTSQRGEFTEERTIEHMPVRCCVPEKEESKKCTLFA